MSFKVAIVGVGENARDHARACRDVPAADLVAICDISAAALQRFGDEFGIQQRFTQLDEMLAQQHLDIVIISTCGAHHAEVGQAAARSGKVRALLVEKPINTTVAECEQMMAVAREHNVLLVEGYKWRHDPQHLRVKEINDSGRIQMDLPYDQRSVRDQEFVDQEDLPSRLHVFCDDFNTEVHQFSPVNQFDLQLANLCECLETHRPHRISPEFNVGNMRVIDTVFKSLETRQPIDL